MKIEKQTRNIIQQALREDVGREDITTLFTIPLHVKTESIIIAKEAGILCGIDIARRTFKERRDDIVFKTLKRDGGVFAKNEHIALIKGDALAILTCERVALNFLSLLSGVSTLTHKFVEKIKGTTAKILDTRKTTPNLRELEKYAVRTGGGYNHRKTLGEAILIKDNHLRAGKFIRHGKLDKHKIQRSIAYLKNYSHIKLEIEIENLDEFKAVIEYKPDIIMLDNFTVAETVKAVAFRNKYYPMVKLESSGGINLNNVREIALTGVDFISIGSLTHSAPAIDFSLEIVDK